jgi:hypothetical protein
MTGIENNNREAFYAKERELLKLDGITEVINPGRTVIEVDYEKRLEQERPDWSDYMRACIKELCRADLITFLPGWLNSRGSMLEKEIADKLSIKELQIKNGTIDWGETL